MKKGVEMINIDTFVKSKQIQFIYTIINNEMDSWNAIGKQWLFCFLCKCSAIKGSDIASIPKYHRDAIQAWIIIFFSHVLNDILDKKIFGNSDIKFNRNPLFCNRF